jgi:quinol monooxygenase YgiN
MDAIACPGMRGEGSIDATGSPFTSADWHVRVGNEQAFVEAWTELARISLATPGARDFLLIRDVADPRHFVSIGRWQDLGTVTLSRSRERFLSQFRRCQALCEHSQGSDFILVVAAPAEAEPRR